MALRSSLLSAACAVALAAVSLSARAESALSVLGTDFAFPNRIEGLPGKLSEFPQLQVNAFVTGDGVRLNYWEAGSGRPLIFVPGWSANGAQYVNLIFMLSQHYHVYVLDPRNQGLSQHVDYGSRIARMSMDLKEFGDHLGIHSADYVGHSMGSAVLWSYIDLFGTSAIRRIAFVDEPISIYSHNNWSEAERLEAGGTTTAPERMVEAFTAGGPVNRLVTDMKPFERAKLMDSPYFANSESFARAVVRSDPKAMGQVLFNHIVSDWRDVIRTKVNVPTAIFSGEESNNLPSQRWMASAIPNAQLFVYTGAEQGDHFLMFKNPLRFTTDLRSFLDR